MTEIEKSKELPQAKIQQHHKDLTQSADKFITALGGYQNTKSFAEKEHFKAIMDQQLGLIQSAVNELKRGGIHKQEVKVENDYKKFIATGSNESYSALTHDLATLKEYNQ